MCRSKGPHPPLRCGRPDPSLKIACPLATNLREGSPCGSPARQAGSPSHATNPFFKPGPGHKPRWPRPRRSICPRARPCSLNRGRGYAFGRGHAHKIRGDHRGRWRNMRAGPHIAPSRAGRFQISGKTVSAWSRKMSIVQPARARNGPKGTCWSRCQRPRSIVTRE